LAAGEGTDESVKACATWGFAASAKQTAIFHH
jgi:hypothetical protein